MFGDPISLRRSDLRPKSDKRWRAQVEAVAERFRVAFPDIVFDIAWNVRALNGAAWREVKQRNVSLYGDLVRHRLIGIEAIALLFAHETGHHHGGEPKDDFYDWMTCELQADRWAAQHGVALAWRDDQREAARIVRTGARQLLVFERRVIKNDGYMSGQDGCDAPAHASPDARYRFLLDASRVLTSG